MILQRPLAAFAAGRVQSISVTLMWRAGGRFRLTAFFGLLKAALNHAFTDGKVVLLSSVVLR